MKTTVLIAVFIVSILFMPCQIVADTNLDQETPIPIEIGTINGTLNYTTTSITYSIEITNGEYVFELTADTGTDFELYLLTTEGEEIDASTKSFYPETLTFVSISNQTILVKVEQNSGTGVFSLIVTKHALKTLLLGSNNVQINETYSEKYFVFKAEIGLYNFLLADENHDLNIKLFNISFFYITSGGYNDKLSYYSGSNQSLVVGITSYGSTGSFVINISKETIDKIDRGVTKGNLVETGVTRFYLLDVYDGVYRINLGTEDDSNTFNLYLYDKTFDLLDSAIYGKTNLEYRSYSESYIIIKLFAYFGSGSFDLYVEEILDAPLPESFVEIDSSTNFDIYEISGVLETTINITLEMHGNVFYMALVDTKLSAFVRDVISRELDENRNPHNLINTHDTFFDIYGNHTISYSSSLNNVYLVVYESTNEFGFNETGYRISSAELLTPITVSNDYASYLDYSYSGTIYDNDDFSWDDGEFLIYTSFILYPGDTLDLYVEVDGNDDLFIFMFNGEDEEDIGNAFDVIYTANYKNETLHIYNYGFTNGDAGLSYKATNSVSINIAFTAKGYSDKSIDFTFRINIEHSGEIINTVAGSDRFSKNSSSLPLFLLIATLIFAIYSKMKMSDSK